MKYRSEIDGLRALAVVPVILFHAGFKAFSGGFVGVDVFFVISGYLITTILLNELESGRFLIVQFYERRARRILPALFTVMLVCLPFAWFWLLPQDMESFSQSLVSISVFASNILFWRTSGYFDTTTELKPLIHTWSLSVEEQYYLLFPLFMLFAWKLGKRWTIGILAVVSLISFAFAQWLVYRNPSFTFYMLPTRAWELLIGAFVAFYYSEHNIKKHNYLASELGSVLGFALISFAIFAYNEQTPFPSLYALAPTIGAALIIVFATNQTAIGKLLSTKPFLWIGLISYSAYLWHQPLFAFARHRSLEQPTPQLLTFLAILTIPLAYLTWRFVERPFRNKHLISRNQILALGLICSLFFTITGFIGHVSNGVPARLPQATLKVFQGPSDIYPNYCNSRPGNYIDPARACVIGNNSNVVGALIGDSHAEAIRLSLGQQLHRIGEGVVDLTSNGCSPIFGFFTTYSGIECLNKKEKNFTYINSNDSLQFVIISGRWSSALVGPVFDNEEGGSEPPNQYTQMLSINGETKPVLNLDRKVVGQKLIETIESYMATGKQIILVYPIPEAGWNVPIKMAKDTLILRKESFTQDYLSTSYDVYKKRNSDAIKLFDSIGERSNLKRIRPDRILCNTYVPNRCITQLNGVSLYSDDDHLNYFGANLISNEIVKHIIAISSQ
jgi:peptidoglycan/LPS O-acetylase OafA/YrhL